MNIFKKVDIDHLSPIILFFTLTLPYVLFVALTHTVFNPTGIHYPFLKPRYLPSNEVPSEIFSNWPMFWSIFLIFLIVSLISYILFKYFRKSIRITALIFFVASLAIQALVLYLQKNQMDHLYDQTITVMNGTWFSLEHQFSKLPQFAKGNFFEKINFLYKSGMFKNNKTFSLIGTTHPPLYIIYAYTLKSISELFGSSKIAWSIIVTLINSLQIPLLFLLSTKIFSKSYSFFIALLGAFSATAAMHFCASLDVVSSTILASSLLIIYKLLNTKDHDWIRLKPILLLMSISFLFTMTAQISYGLAIPIFAYSVAMLILKKDVFKKFPRLIIIYLSIPFLLFAIELILSGGNVFWPVRMFTIAIHVKKGLIANGRHLLSSQSANLTVMSFMGGILFFPTIFFYFIKGFLKKKDVSNIFSRFLALSLFIMVFILIFQQTARLEVERTWHWLFMPVWILTGELLMIVNDQFKNVRSEIFLKCSLLLVVQIITMLVFIISFQDYY